MQNIDPVLLLEPVIFIGLSLGTILYWRAKRRFAAVVLLYSLIAYAVAIGMKEVFQAVTYGAVVSSFGPSSWQTGVYFGLQTSFFEVGLAYIVARYAVRKKQMGPRDAEGYGIGLAFWENGVLLGALSLVNLAATYLLIADNFLPQSTYQIIVSSEPGLFDTPQQLAVPIALATLERVSSLFAHLAWGYLCVLAVVMKKRGYFFVALPMGMLDALVSFASQVPTWFFELSIFVLSLGFLVVALRVGRPAEKAVLAASSN